MKEGKLVFDPRPKLLLLFTMGVLFLEMQAVIFLTDIPRFFALFL